MQTEYIAVGNLPNLSEIERSKFVVFSAELLKAWRKEKGFTQLTFSQATGIAFQTIKTWELGVKPDMAGLGKLGRFFGVYFYAPWPENNQSEKGSI